MTRHKLQVTSLRHDAAQQWNGEPLAETEISVGTSYCIFCLQKFVKTLDKVAYVTHALTSYLVVREDKCSCLALASCCCVLLVLMNTKSF
jgi:hypothetical protein